VQTLSAFVEKNGLQGAIFYPGDGVAAPRDLLPALRSVAASAGVEFREHAEVPSIKCLPNQVEIGGESFSSVVVAAGAWSSALQLSGAPPLPEVRPVKGHLLAFELQLGACPTIIRHRHIYIFQRGNGTVIVGATVENAGFDHSIDPAKARELHLQATAILPVLEKLNPIDLWTGLRPKSEQLRLGWWQDTPVYMAYGHYRNGILLAPATAERAVRDYRTAGYI
jgi:glycine oxidase